MEAPLVPVQTPIHEIMSDPKLPHCKYNSQIQNQNTSERNGEREDEIYISKNNNEIKIRMFRLALVVCRYDEVVGVEETGEDAERGDEDDGDFPGADAGDLERVAHHDVTLHHHQHHEPIGDGGKQSL